MYLLRKLSVLSLIVISLSAYSSPGKEQSELNFKSGVDFCNFLLNKTTVLARGRAVFGLSKEQLVKKTYLDDDKADYGMDFYGFEMNVINVIYDNGSLKFTKDNYENLKHSTEYEQKIFSRCIDQYGKLDSMTLGEFE